MSCLSAEEACANCGSPRVQLKSVTRSDGKAELRRSVAKARPVPVATFEKAAA
jgi:hypothetical protein